MRTRRVERPRTALADMNEEDTHTQTLVDVYEPRSKHAKTTLVKRGRFVHKTLQTIRSTSKPITPALYMVISMRRTQNAVKR